MSAIDDEIFLNAEEDAQEVEFIKNNLPQELKEKFSDEELYYFIDVITEYYLDSGVFNAQPDKDGYIDLDLDAVVNHVVKKAKKEKMGEFKPEDILFVVQADLDFAESLDDEDEE